jgi:pimeloyl-ACP methyl ester carboxylesterase
MTRGVLASAGFTRQEIDGTVLFWSAAAGAAAFESGGSAAALQTVVLLHGVNDQAGTWFTVAPALAKRFRVIIPDLPGHGESAPEAAPLPISHILDRLDRVMPDEPFMLVGNSLGGWLAMLYTLRRPERVRQLVLEASGGLDRPFASAVIAHDREEAVAILRAVHGPDYAASDWVIEALLARAHDSPMLRVTELAEHYVDERLRDIRVPTDLIWGADDGVLPIAYAEALQRGIAGAKLHVIEGAAHIPHLHQPERFLQCLTAIC